MGSSRSHHRRSHSFLLPLQVCFATSQVIRSLTYTNNSCISARRRKRVGGRPMYGTGWAAAPFGHGPATYNPNFQSQQAAPAREDYNSPPTYQQQGGYYGENQGYFGGQQTGTELQQPQNTYRGGDPVYEAPVGPPPKKERDGIIR